MRTWLKRMVAGIVSAGTLMGGGLLMAGTANADEIRMPDIGKTITSLTASAATTYPRELVNGGFDYLPADASTLPDHLINGDFEYPTADIMGKSDGRFWYISQNDNSWWANVKLTGKEKRSTLPAGFDKSKFAWHSTQTGNTHYPTLERADDIQVDYKGDGTNHYSEITAAQAGSTLYQDVATTPGVMYRWSLKHASINSANIDRMSVMIGEPGKETAQEATRTTVNGNGDKTGKVGTEIATKVSNSASDGWNRVGQWETYTGTYIATSTVTRFAFRSIEGGGKTQGEAWDGNLLDDVQFTKAYKLSYDKNASDASGSVPSNGSADTTQPASTSGESGVKTAADTSDDANKVVNGDFEFPKWSQYDPKAGGSEALPWMYLDTQTGKAKTYWQAMAGNSGKTIKGLNTTTFPWVDLDHPGQFEIHREKNGNLYADVHKDRTVGQVLQTEPNTSYTVSIRHSARSKTRAGHENSEPGAITMLAGPDKDHLTAIELTRTTLSETGRKAGQKLGPAGTTVTSPDDSVDGTTDHAGWDHTNGWETYTGTYIVPAGQTSTLFAYRGSVDDSCIDDLSFTKAYPLSYDKNAQDASGSVPSRTKANGTETAAATGTGSVKTAADTTTNKLPDHLVNGDFEYPSMKSLQHYFTGIDRNRSQWISNGQGDDFAKWSDIPGGLDTTRFGWSSTQTQGAMSEQRANAVELQKATGETTQMGELCASQKGTAIYQDIATTPGTLYRIELDHASRYRIHLDQMQVMVGAPGHEQPVEMTRTSSNKYGDKIGEKSTTIATHSTNPFGNQSSKDDFSHYVGYYTIPAGQSVTRFTFRQVSGVNTTSGNLLDNIVFTQAYRLTYDKNASDASGQVPSNERGKENTVQPAKSKTTGSVRLAADKTASGLTVHDLKNGEIAPAQYGDFKFSTTDGFTADQITDVNGFDVKTNWDPTEENQAYAGKILSTMYQPNKNGANLILHHVGQWRDSSGMQRWLNARITVNGQNLGTLVYIPSTRKFVASYGKWDLHPSSRPYMDVTVDFLLDDGSTPQGLRGVTGFTDIDGGTSGYNEGVELVSGFDGAYVRSDAHLARFGTNGWAGITDENKNDADAHGMKHYVGATFTGSSFRARWSVASGQARQSGFQPVDSTIAYRLTYDKNGRDATGSIPSDTAANTTRPAKSETDGKVSDLVQRTTTHEDGSVTVKTIDTSTGAVSGCQVYYPAGTRITLATAKADSDCWDSSQIGRPNRTFYGWSANTDANDRDVPVGDTMDRNTLNANVRTEIVMPARAKTVYALWAINPTLSYNVNAPAGSNAPGTPASQTVPYNTAAADKSGWAAGDTGKIPGYRFDGWYTAPNSGNKYDFNTPLTNNVTVYAHWVGNGYTVRFAGNGATGGNTPDQAFQYNIGQNLHRNGFTRDGYTFTGWKRADNQQAYGDGQWVNNLTTQPNGIVTMVAQWSANEAHIRYNPNPPAGKTAGGNGTPNWDGHTGDTPAIGGNGWTIDGYTFAGWTTSPDGSGARYAPGASWTANGTLTLYAQWTPGEAGLTYDGNGATGGKTDPQNGVTDQKVNVRQNGFTRDGYTFVTWNTQADCKGNAVKPNSEWTLRGSSTLYACWAGVAQTLTYHGNGATGGNTAAQSGHTGDELTTNANGFTRDGYTFVRWDTAKDGSGTAYGEGKNGVSQYVMKPAGNDLYAIWKANPATIQYRNDWPNTTGSTPDTTGVTGQDVTIARNGFTRPGYTFTGWARDRRTNPSLQPGGRYTLTPGTTTLWAQWKADPAHLIYNSNSGSTSQARRTDGVVDQTLTVIANPFTRTGYTFTGWNTQADGRGRAYTAGNGFRLVADPKSNPVNTSVLYAQWRINRVTLKFNPNGGTGGYPDITADAFTTVTIPADAKEPKVQRPGFRFTGWAMKPTPGAGDTILSPGKGTVSMPDQGSITVYAQWAPAMTTLPFTGGHAQVPTIWLYAGFALMLIALGVMMPMLRMRMAATKRTGKHMPITGGKHAK